MTKGSPIPSWKTQPDLLHHQNSSPLAVNHCPRDMLLACVTARNRAVPLAPGGARLSRSMARAGLRKVDRVDLTGRFLREWTIPVPEDSAVGSGIDKQAPSRGGRGHLPCRTSPAQAPIELHAFFQRPGKTAAPATCFKTFVLYNRLRGDVNWGISRNRNCLIRTVQEARPRKPIGQACRISPRTQKADC